MKKCSMCGNKVNDDKYCCPHCGSNNFFFEQYYQPMYYNYGYQNNQKGNFAWAVLGFFVPIVGLILFLIWNSTDKKNANYAGIGALIGFILSFVLVAIITAIATPLINDLMDQSVKRSCCADAGGVWEDNVCTTRNYTYYYSCIDKSHN